MPKQREGDVFMRCLLVVSVAIILAAAGLIRVDSPAEAAGGGYASGCGGGEIFLYATEKRMLTLHNNARKNYGLKPLCVHPVLQKAARAHSKDMIQHHYFSHYSSESNETPCTRILRFGYAWSSCGENIGYNATPDDLFRSWMRSSIHQRIILDERFREIGIGAYTGDYNDSETTMYTVDFGAPAEQTSEYPNY
jgi:uncharacterized protein YkwD